MLLVYGPRSTDYDFGHDHPLTPRRFGPGIDLLRELGAEPELAPEPARDEELRWLHTRPYIDVVKRFSVDPFGFAQAGIGDHGDCPPFADMHEASSAVAGGSVRALEAILRGEVEHAVHPGGGLHHAMPARGSGFCIYNDVALAIVRARQDGLRVLYVDLDVHHGDGVQAMLWDDPGVLTFSIHETGRALFPGSGEADEIGEGVAAGTSVNVPLLPGTGEGAWLAILESLLPELAATFGPDLIVSQHGADSHAWDPLAHLSVTTTAHGAAARLVDALAHRYASGRWLATGGGGYDAYRVVPRTWALTWLAGTHREVPDRTPEAWRDRWAGEAARYRQAPLPERFDDPPNAGIEFGAAQAAVEARSAGDAALVRRVLVPRLVREARDRGWWDPMAPVALGSVLPSGEGSAASGAGGGSGDPTILSSVDADTWSRLVLEPSVIAPAAATDAHAIVLAALIDGASVTGAVRGTSVVGLVISRDAEGTARTDLLAIGVAPRDRRGGLAGRMLADHLAEIRPGDGPEVRRGELAVDCEVTVAERDVFDPLDRSVRGSIARRLLEGAGFRVEPASEAVRSIDPGAVVGRR